MNQLGRSILLAAATAVVAVAPASIATGAADVDGPVRAIAERAAEVTVEERTLLEVSTATNLNSEARAEIEGRIQAVDALGVGLLDQLDRLDVDLTEAIRTSLGPLATVEERMLRPDAFVPPTAVYDAATADLLRIAAAPSAVTNAPSPSSSPAFGLLAVAALALLALGAAALGNSLRRRPEADEVARMAWSDGLTGLANRRRLDADLARFDDGELATAAIMVDIDDFDAITDTFGHIVGDDVLRRVGDALSKQVRFDDVVYRYGDEAFCVLLPGASANDAGDIADRVVRAARSVELPDGRTITVSVGVADGRHADATEAVRRADAALTAARDDGRATAPSQ